MKSASKAAKPYWEMNAEELAAATREFDGESIEGFVPLGAEKKKIWQRLQDSNNADKSLKGLSQVDPGKSPRSSKKKRKASKG